MDTLHPVVGTYYDSAFRTASARPMSLDQYINMVKNGDAAPQVNRLRDQVKAGDGAGAEKTKKNLPLYVVGGEMQGGRRLEHMVRYSACICADIDNPAISPEEVLRIAGNLPYVKAGHISPSGTGNKLFVPVGCALEHHALAFEIVRRRVEADIPGVVVDTSGKDPNRGCFLSYDPTAFYKEEAEALQVPVPDPSLSAHAPCPSGARLTGQSLTNYIDKYEQDNPFAAGGRHSHVVKLAAALNNAGFSQYEVAAECTRRYTQPDFHATEIEKIVTDIYRRYSTSHGSNPYRPKEAPESRKTAGTAKIAPDGVSGGPVADGEGEGADIEPDNTLLPCFDESIYEHLPSLLADVVKRAENRTEKDILLLSALTLLSSAMPGVRGSLKEHEYAPPLYTIITGSSGSGKGCVAGLQKLLDPWQQYIYDNSSYEVEQYEQENEEYEAYKMQKRQNRTPKQPAGPAPSKPKVVKQRNLRITGGVTQARLVELLHVNHPYTSCLLDTEMETIVNMLSQDFGNYSDIINKAAHHETVGSSSKKDGSLLAKFPCLAILCTGTPALLPRLIPSTENGLFSRFLMYKIPGGGKYHPLTSADDTPAASSHLDSIGQRVLDYGVFLDGSPTWVNFSNAQRKKLDRFLESEYYNVRSFGHEDLESTVLRYRLVIFRMGMTLTCLRKAESGLTERIWTMSDDDFNLAFHIGKTCLQHAYVVATSLKQASGEVHFKFPHAMRNLFASLPESFKRSDALDAANGCGVSASSLDKFFRKAEKNDLIVSEGAGYYRKTELGKQVVAI